MALSGSSKPRFPGNQSTQIPANIDVSSLSSDQLRAILGPLTGSVFRARLRTLLPRNQVLRQIILRRQTMNSNFWQGKRSGALALTALAAVVAMAGAVVPAQGQILPVTF